MLILFFILSIIIATSVFFAKNKATNRILVPLYLILLSLLNVNACLHIGSTDSHFFSFNSLGVLLTSVLNILSFCTYYYSLIYLKKKETSSKKESQYFSAMILFITAMVSANFTDNIAVLWASIEASTLFVSVLIFQERSKDALEAAWKYLYISSVGVAIAFIGILFMSIVSSKNGLNNLSFENLALAAINMNPIWLKISFLLILTGFSVKISLFPLYAVAIDAKTIAASPASALMSTALVNVGFIVIFRTFVIISHTEILAWAQNILMFTALISIIIATIQLTRVKRLKRLYAFSTMEHMGIVFLGLAVGGIGYYAAVLHLVFHSFIKAGLFYQINQIHEQYKSKWIIDFKGFFKINPSAAMVMITGLISITAIPPSGMFVSEFLIFKALFLNNNYLIAIISLFFLTFIIYTFFKNFMHILFEPSPERTVFDNKLQVQTFIPFILFGLVVYLGMTPPRFFTDIINEIVFVLN